MANQIDYVIERSSRQYKICREAQSIMEEIKAGRLIKCDGTIYSFDALTGSEIYFMKGYYKVTVSLNEVIENKPFYQINITLYDPEMDLYYSISTYIRDLNNTDFYKDIFDEIIIYPHDG